MTGMVTNNNVADMEQKQQKLRKLQIFAWMRPQIQINAIVQSVVKTFNLNLQEGNF